MAVTDKMHFNRFTPFGLNKLGIDQHSNFCVGLFVALLKVQN